MILTVPHCLHHLLSSSLFITGYYALDNDLSPQKGHLEFVLVGGGWICPTGSYVGARMYCKGIKQTLSFFMVSQSGAFECDNAIGESP